MSNDTNLYLLKDVSWRFGHPEGGQAELCITTEYGLDSYHLVIEAEKFTIESEEEAKELLDLLMHCLREANSWAG